VRHNPLSGLGCRHLLVRHSGRSHLSHTSPASTAACGPPNRWTRRC